MDKLKAAKRFDQVIYCGAFEFIHQAQAAHPKNIH
jgi:hypothetical protein